MIAVVACLIVLAFVNYTVALRMILRRGWISPTDTFGRRRSEGTRMSTAVFLALFLMFIWPAVMVATLETRAERAARRRAEVAEHEAREARALRDRARALGIEE